MTDSLKLVKVALTYGDGTEKSLEGDEAEQWNQDQMSVCMFAQIHNQNPFVNRNYNWAITKKDK